MVDKLIFCGSLSKVDAMIDDREERKNEEIHREKLKTDNIKYIHAQIKGSHWYFIRVGKSSSSSQLKDFVKSNVKPGFKCYHTTDIDEVAEIVQNVCDNLYVRSSELVAL